LQRCRGRAEWPAATVARRGNGRLIAVAVHESVLKQLRDAAGAGAVDSHGHTVTPPTEDGVIAAVRVCAATHTPLRVRSSAAGSGHAPHDGVLLSLERLQSIDLRAAGITVRAGAGASVDDIRRQADAAKLAIVGLGRGGAGETVGALIGRGAVPRRSLTGVEAVLTTGETVRFGGGALKDVVGYDVPTLLLGSMGSLAILLAATFRLEPAGARTVSGPTPGVVRVDASLRRAFDPEGLLQSHS
ncbi:MAG: FAD-binding oxidoreductase, partial [Candidatus Dormibacteria bacterium]